MCKKQTAVSHSSTTDAEVISLDAVLRRDGILTLWDLVIEVFHSVQNCLLNPCNVVAQLVTSQLVTVDTTMTFMSFTDVLSSSRITRKQFASSIVHGALAPVLCCFPILHGSGAGCPGIGILI